MKHSRIIAATLVTFVLAIGAMMAAPVTEPAFATEPALAAGAFSSTDDNPSLEAQATKYKIWVAGKQVTSANKSDVLGNGTVSFNAKTHTLTLKNAKIAKAYVAESVGESGYTFHYNYGIEDATGKTLTVKLVGKNTIKMPSKKSPVMNYGILGSNITITGSGSLTTTGGKAQVYSSGICCDVLTLQGSVKLVSKGASTKLVSKGIRYLKKYGGYGVIAEKKLVMKGSAQLTANGPKGALYKDGNPTVSFGSGYTPQVKAGPSASNITVNKKSPAKSVYKKYKYLNVSKASTAGTFTIKSLKADTGSLDVSWTKTSKSSGYQIQLCTDRDFVHGLLTDVKYTTSSSGSWKGISKGSNHYALFGGHTYYVRGRTFEVLGASEFGNFGKWSAVKKVKVP